MYRSSDWSLVVLEKPMLNHKHPHIVKHLYISPGRYYCLNWLHNIWLLGSGFISYRSQFDRLFRNSLSIHLSKVINIKLPTSRSTCNITKQSYMYRIKHTCTYSTMQPSNNVQVVWFINVGKSNVLEQITVMVMEDERFG